MVETSLLQKEQNEHLKGEVGQARRGTSAGMMRYVFFKTGLLHIHLGGHRLAVLIDSCKLHNNRLYWTCLSHSSVCLLKSDICMYRTFINSQWAPGCLRSLEDKALPQGQMSRSWRGPCGQFVATVCLGCMPGAGKVSGYFVAYPGALLMHWGLSGGAG